MASSTTGQVLKEAILFVKNAPSGFSEMDIFRVFKKFGPIDNIRFGSTHDQKSFCIVSMLTVEAADNVRANLCGGVLSDVGYSLQVSDWKTDEDRPKKPLLKSSKSLKSTPVLSTTPKGLKVFTTVLSLGKEIAVKSVAHLPKNFSTAASESTFTVLPVQGQGYDEWLENLSKIIEESCTGKTPYNKLEINGDYLYKHKDNYYRVRLINEKSVYLLDVGTIVPLVASNIFELRKKYTVFPGKVAVCELEGVTWNIGNFEKLREVIRQCSNTLGVLSVKTGDFKEGVNFVKISIENDNLAEKLVEKGLCTYVSETVARKFIYDRDTLCGLRYLGNEDNLDESGKAILQSLANLRIRV